jgi:hypothetical protein
MNLWDKRDDMVAGTEETRLIVLRGNSASGKCSQAESWPSRVRQRMYSRSMAAIAASTVNTMPEGPALDPQAGGGCDLYG